jgi:hypothetical protein
LYESASVSTRRCRDAGAVALEAREAEVLAVKPIRLASILPSFEIDRQRDDTSDDERPDAADVEDPRVPAARLTVTADPFEAAVVLPLDQQVQRCEQDHPEQPGRGVELQATAAFQPRACAGALAFVGLLVGGATLAAFALPYE